MRALKGSQRDLEFSQAVDDYNTDFTTTGIGAIQFLRRGFSITFGFRDLFARRPQTIW
jgi:hypothetical protein